MPVIAINNSRPRCLLCRVGSLQAGLDRTGQGSLVRQHAHSSWSREQTASRHSPPSFLCPGLAPALPFVPSGADRLEPSNETAATATVIEG